MNGTWMAGEGAARRMGARERVRRTLAHRKTDRMARGELCVEDSVIRAFLDVATVGFPERLEFFRRLDLDIVCVHPQYGVEDGHLPEARDIRWPDLESWVDESGLFVFALMDGPFEWGMRIFGWERFLTLPLKDARALEAFLQDVSRLNRRLTGRLLGRGIDGMILADDLAYQKGLFASPEIMRTSILPYTALQVEEVLDKGTPVFFHSDGRFEELIPDLIRIGFRGLHCIDGNAGMDVQRIRDTYGDALCLWGHLSVEDLAGWKEPTYAQDLRDELALLSASGGCILGTTCGIFEGIDLEALIAIHNSPQAGA